ncbi:MAG TPA: hypothetical protein VEK57_00020 [Thermoanaerobaculia bacterium]|nr:hypothetical protein [Thermoanaerobaculia bacterium]
MRPLVPLVLLLSLSVHAAPKVQVPRVPASPKVDGVITSKEWKDAVRVPLGTGGHAMLQHNGTYLFVALVGRRSGIGSLCTMNKDEVQVLHASAALGTATFKRDGTKWVSNRPFAWTNRDTSASEAAMADRKKFLDTEGWFANAQPVGSPKREFQIRIGGRGEIPLTLGFMGFIRKGEFDLSSWPEKLPDGCGELDLAGGYTDREYSFDPETWGVAEIR